MLAARSIGYPIALRLRALELPSMVFPRHLFVDTHLPVPSLRAATPTRRGNSDKLPCVRVTGDRSARQGSVPMCRRRTPYIDLLCDPYMELNV